VLSLRRLAVLDEVLERSKRSRPNPLELIGDDRLEQPSDAPPFRMTSALLVSSVRSPSGSTVHSFFARATSGMPMPS
jgi:hypothetical protein